MKNLAFSYHNPALWLTSQTKRLHTAKEGRSTLYFENFISLFIALASFLRKLLWLSFTVFILHSSSSNIQPSFGLSTGVAVII